MTKFNICTRWTVEADMIVEAETIKDAKAKLCGKELFGEKENNEFSFDKEKLDDLDIKLGSVWAYGDPSPFLVSLVHYWKIGASTINKAEDHDPNPLITDALKEANKAMDKKGNKILDWIYAARLGWYLCLEAVMIIGTIVLFGIGCYLVFLGV